MRDLQPLDPQFRSRVAKLFARAPFLTHLGVALDSVEAGAVTTAIVLRPDFHMQQDGFVHAGVQATLADHSAGAAAATLIRADQIVLTVEFKINLLRPAIGERLTCRAQVLRAGRTLTVVEADVFAWQHGEARQTARALVTIANVADFRAAD